MNQNAGCSIAFWAIIIIVIAFSVDTTLGVVLLCIIGAIFIIFLAYLVSNPAKDSSNKTATSQSAPQAASAKKSAVKEAKMVEDVTVAGRRDPFGEVDAETFRSLSESVDRLYGIYTDLLQIGSFQKAFHDVLELGLDIPVTAAGIEPYYKRCFVSDVAACSKGMCIGTDTRTADGLGIALVAIRLSGREPLAFAELQDLCSEEMQQLIGSQTELPDPAIVEKHQSLFFIIADVLARYSFEAYRKYQIALYQYSFALSRLTPYSDVKKTWLNAMLGMWGAASKAVRETRENFEQDEKNL